MEKEMIIIGDIHAQWRKLARQLGYKGIKDTNLIGVGDFGVGFKHDGRSVEESRRWEEHLLGQLGASLDASRCTLHLLRGNHDDPAYFNGGRGVEGRIIYHPDYTVLTLEHLHVLLVGGAVSIDRSVRVPGETWWAGERARYDEDALERALEGLERLDVVATHSAPGFAFPPDKLAGDLAGWLARDPALADDMREERGIFDRIHAKLLERGLRPACWFYGHFHRTNRQLIDGTHFICLNELRMMRIP